MADEARYTAIGALVAAVFGILAKLISASVGLWKSRHEEDERHEQESRTESISERTLAYTELRDRIFDLKAELNDERKRNDVLSGYVEDLRRENMNLRNENMRLRDRGSNHE